jgi:hypothetical protein
MKKAFGITALILGVVGCAASVAAVVFGAVALGQGKRHIY